MPIIELVEFMDEITDDEFCVEICLGIDHETRKDFDQILEYCSRRLHRDSVCVSSNLVEKLERQKRRLVTFCLLSTYKQFKSDEWNFFKSAAIPELISKMFNTGCHDDAFLLWRRHSTGNLFRLYGR